MEDYSLKNIAFAYIPIVIIGGVTNIVTFCCLVRFMSRNTNRQGNYERLALALNVFDSIFCMVAVPMKMYIYLLGIDAENKPLYLVSIEGICFWASSLLVVLIAGNSYFKMTRPVRYNATITAQRIYISIFVTFGFACLGAVIAVYHRTVFELISGLLIILTIISLFVFYQRIQSAVQQSHDRVRSSLNDKGKRIKELVEQKYAKNVLLLVFTYSICCAKALALFLLYIIFRPNQKDIRELREIATYLITITAIINPCIYVLRGNSYIKLKKRKQHDFQNRTTVRRTRRDQSMEGPISSIRSKIEEKETNVQENHTAETSQQQARKDNQITIPTSCDTESSPSIKGEPSSSQHTVMIHHGIKRIEVAETCA